MALDDYLEPEVAIAVAVTAAVASPPVRKALRKGAVYGLAGLMTAGDKLAALSRNVGERAREAASSLTEAAQGSAENTGNQAAATVEGTAG